MTADQQHRFKHGERVKLTRHIPDLTTDVHPVHLYAGDTGTVIERNGELGVAFDRYDGDITTIRRMLEGETVMIIHYCELLEPEPDQHNGDPMATTYLRVNGIVYRFKVFVNTAWIERQQTGDNVPFSRASSEAARVLFDGVAWDLPAALELISIYEAISTD